MSKFKEKLDKFKKTGGEITTPQNKANKTPPKDKTTTPTLKPNGPKPKGSKPKGLKP